jgi:hypothetical protein
VGRFTNVPHVAYNFLSFLQGAWYIGVNDIEIPEYRTRGFSGYVYDWERILSMRTEYARQDLEMQRLRDQILLFPCVLISPTAFI